MKSVEARGKTREEAIQNALRQLGVELYEVDKIEILDEGSRGLFGFGAREASVRLTCQHLHDTPARAESGADRDRDRGRRGGRGRGGEGRGGEREQSQRGQGGQGGQGQERRDGRQGGGQQARDGQSRGRGGSEQGRGGNDSGRGRGRDNRPAGQQGRGQAQPQPQGGGRGRQPQPVQRRQETPAEAAPAAAADDAPRPKHVSVHDEALDALRRAEMFEQALAEGGMDVQADDNAPLAPAHAEEPADPITDEQGAEAAELLRAMLDKMGLPGEVAFVRADDGAPRLDVKSEHTPMLIGRKGHTLNALQYLVNRMLTKGDTAENTERLVVDVEGYVDRRRQSLEDLARTMASRAKESGRIVRLKPLSPQERRIIHMTLRGDGGVTTASHGDSLYRVVSITPAGGPSPRPQREQRGGQRSGNGGSRRRRGGGGQRGGGRRPQEQDPGTLGD